MPVRCPNCGQENDAYFRFCGMCGTALRTAPVPAQATKSAAATPTGRFEPPPIRFDPPQVPPQREPSNHDPISVAGPSFLGLTEEPRRSADYLLEEDSSSGHWRLYLALFLLLCTAGALYWHWQRDGFPWETQPWQRQVTAEPEPARSPPPDTNANAAKDQQTPPQASQPQPNQPAAVPQNEQKPHEDPASAEAAEDKKPPESKDPQQEDTAAAAAKNAPAKPAPRQEQPEEEDGAAAQKKKPVEVASSAPPTATRPARPSPSRPKALEGDSAAASGVDPTDAIFADGQRYLYGNGVPQDCGQARTKILAAASKANVRAQSTMGAMYATGHCVNRDLPTAYHWFAQALHKDPSNTRVQQDLEMLWRQMTPQERQAATRPTQ